MQRRELRALMCDRPSRNRFRSFCASELCIESFAFAADVADYTSKPCLAAHLTQMHDLFTNTFAALLDKARSGLLPASAANGDRFSSEVDCCRRLQTLYLTTQSDDTRPKTPEDWTECKTAYMEIIIMCKALRAQYLDALRPIWDSFSEAGSSSVVKVGTSMKTGLRSTLVATAFQQHVGGDNDTDDTLSVLSRWQSLDAFLEAQPALCDQERVGEGVLNRHLTNKAVHMQSDQLVQTARASLAVCALADVFEECLAHVEDTVLLHKYELFNQTQLQSDGKAGPPVSPDQQPLANLDDGPADLVSSSSAGSAVKDQSGSLEGVVPAVFRPSDGDTRKLKSESIQVDAARHVQLILDIVEFWRLPSPEVLIEPANSIVSAFVRPGAQMDVKLPGPLRTSLVDAVFNAGSVPLTLSLFEDAQATVMSRLADRDLASFLRSREGSSPTTVTVQDIISGDDPSLRQRFKTYLSTVYRSELLAFWDEASKYRVLASKVESAAVRVQRAQRIFDKYLNLESRMCVGCVPMNASDQVQIAIDSGSISSGEVFIPIVKAVLPELKQLEDIILL